MGEKTSVRFMVILLSAVGWMAVARIVRGEVLSLKQREFVEAARSLGAVGPRIMFRHLIPNSLGPIMVALACRSSARSWPSRRCRSSAMGQARAKAARPGVC